MKMELWGMFLTGIVAGVAIGSLLTWRFFKSRPDAESRGEIQILTERLSGREQVLQETKTRLDAEQVRTLEQQRRIAELEAQIRNDQKSVQEKLSLLNEAQTQFSNAFKALSADALRTNNQSFLELAKTSLGRFQEESRGDLEKRQQAIESLVKPVRESLDRFDNRIQDIEKARVGAYEAINQQVRSLMDTQIQLKSETSNLVKALRSPIARGRWGEIQLKRVVEMAGMLDHCDFSEQASTLTSDGMLRPDLVVRLPGGKNIVVDAKAPLAAYLESIETVNEEVRVQKLKEHAAQIRSHVLQLSRKSYWDQFQPTPEFVVLFLPGEIFFSAALEQDPALIEVGVEKRVILATPTTLIALLRAVSYGWRQEAVAKNAVAISELGRDLYKRIADMTDHLNRLGKNLGQSVDAYNRAMGSFESRVLVSARKFKELETTPAGVEIEELPTLDHAPRELQNQAEV